MLSWKYGFESCSCEGSFLIFWSSKLAAIQVVLKTIYEVLSLGASSSLACSVNYTALVHRLCTALTRRLRKVQLLHAVEQYDEVAKLVRQQSAKLLQVGSSPILISRSKL